MAADPTGKTTNMVIGGKIGDSGFLYFLDSSKGTISWDLKFDSLSNGVYAVAFDGVNVAAISYIEGSSTELLIMIRNAESFVADGSYNTGYKTMPNDYCESEE